MEAMSSVIAAKDMLRQAKEHPRADAARRAGSLGRAPHWSMTMVTDNPNLEQLADCRESIDNLDSALIAILAERFRLTDKIGKMKATAGVKPTDSKRETGQLERFHECAEAHKLDVDVAVDIMTLVIQHAKKRQDALQDAAINPP